MNPYSRFRLITNFLTAALVAGGLCAVWPAVSGMIAAAAGGVTAVYWAGVATAATLTVIASLLMSELVLPALFQWSVLRKMVLGRDYVEGTWLSAERGPSGTERLTVMHIRPAGFGYDLSGYSLNQENEIESNRMIAWSKLDGPVMSCAYRTLMPDGAGNQAQFSSEMMFEQRRGAPRSVAGFGMAAGGSRRFQVEGVKLTKWSERRRLKKLEQRGEVVAKYWDLFFGVVAEADTAGTPVTVHRPVVVVSEASRTPFVERRNPDNTPEEGTIVARRRATDWRQEDATPTADRIRARMMADLEEAAEDEDLDAADVEDEIEYDAEEVEADDDVMLEDEAEDLDEAVEDEEYDAEADEDLEAEEDEEYEAEEDDEVEAEEDGEYDAETEDEVDGDAEPVEKEADAEPRIRQRYARR